MQQSNDTTLATAVESRDRRLAVRLLIDWEKNGSWSYVMDGVDYGDLSDLVVEWTRQSNLAGALPVDSTLLEGAAATQLDLTLSGNLRQGGASATEIFSPYQPASPRYGKTIKGSPVRLSVLEETALGVVETRQFTGKIQVARIEAASGQVSVTCLDAVQDLQATLSIPPWADGKSLEDHNYMVNSAWLLDRCARASGYYTTPPAHPDAVLSATLHGATTPEIGFPTQMQLLTKYTGGPDYPWVKTLSDAIHLHNYWSYGTGTSNVEGLVYNTVRPPRPNVGRTIGMAYRVCYANGGDNVMNVDFNQPPAEIVIPNYGYPNDKYVIDPATMGLELDPNGYATVHLSNSYNGSTYYHYLTTNRALALWEWAGVQAEATFAADSVTLRIRFGEEAWTEQTFAGAFGAYTPAPEFAGYPFIEWPQRVGISTQWTPLTNAQVYDTATPKQTVFPSNFQATASYDLGTNRFNHIPEVRDEKAWDVMRDVVSAEFGSLFVDEYGVVKFWNRETSRAQQETADKTLSSSVVSDIGMTDSIDTLINAFQGETTRATLGNVTVWTANQAGYVWDREVVPPVRKTFADYDDLTVQPGTANPLRFYPEVTNMVAPAIQGRNLLPQIAAADWQSKQDGQWFQACSAVIAQANGASAPAGQATVDVWTDTQNTLLVALFNHPYQSGTTPAIQFANKYIDQSQLSADVTNKNLTQSDGRFAVEIPGRGLKSLAGVLYEVQDSGSIDAFGYQPYELEKNRWRQSHATMTYLCGQLLEETKNPPPLMDELEAPGDQRIQLGDTVEITDAVTIGDSLMAMVSGIRRTMSASGFVDRYTLKLTIRPTSWILGNSAYSVLGETTFLDNSQVS